MSDERKFVVITTINGPTPVVKKLVNEHPDWKIIVVGDKKTPKNWKYKNVRYLSPETQLKLDYEVVKLIPWNHYSRKIVGYLYAIERGADIIADLDDDNIPYSNWGKLPEKGHYKIITSPPFYNVYKKFSPAFNWPRGYPLNYIKRPSAKFRISKKMNPVGVWQFLADKDPDVDAIYRLLYDKPIYFDKNKSFALDRETYCPFNSQNTFFVKDLFPLLYLPTFVNFRFMDILRSILTQYIIWRYGYLLGFSSPSVIQNRNPHDYMEDFESEIPAYLNVEKIVTLFDKISLKSGDISSNLLEIYRILIKTGFVDSKEYKLLKAWGRDLKNLQ